MVLAMSNDQARTAAKGDQHLDQVGWKVASEKCTSKNERHPKEHKDKNGLSSVPSVSSEDCEDTGESDENRQNTMRVLL
jgi:hypothetical protein